MTPLPISNEAKKGLSFSFTVLLFICCTISKTYAQDDSIVIIKKDPVIINRPVHVIQYKPFAFEEKKFYLQLGGGVFTHFDHYTICENCKDYVNEVKGNTDAGLDYNGFVRFIYSPKRLSIGLELSYTTFQDRYRHTLANGTETSFKNTYAYGDFGLSGGYWLLPKTKKIALLALSSIHRSQKISAQGTTLKEDDILQLTDLNTERTLNSSIYYLSIGFQAYFKISEQLRLGLEPFYRFDLSSVTDRNEPFTLQRNVLGTKLMVVKGF